MKSLTFRRGLHERHNDGGSVLKAFGPVAKIGMMWYDET
jgi:hypothetical protein